MRRAERRDRERGLNRLVRLGPTGAVLHTNAAVDVSYTNSYDNTTRRENVALRGQKLAGNKSCIRADLTTGEYIGTAISADDGGYVDCAVFVNGRKFAESVDDSLYYRNAIC